MRASLVVNVKRMNRFIAISVIALLVSACAPWSQNTLPDGRIGYVTYCSGVWDSWANCQRKAEFLCSDRGYTILSTTGDKGLIATEGAANFFDETTVARVMLMVCN